MKEKTVNYTPEMVAEMVASYEQNPTQETIAALAAKFEKKPRSVIAKLSAEGVYLKQEKVGKTKAGVDVIRKEELVAQVNQALGIELPSLSKVTKVDLMALLNVVGKQK